MKPRDRRGAKLAPARTRSRALQQGGVDGAVPGGQLLLESTAAAARALLSLRDVHEVPQTRFLTELIKALEWPVGREDATVVDLTCRCKRLHCCFQKEPNAICSKEESLLDNQTSGFCK